MVTIISLVRRLLAGSSDLPESRDGPDQPCSHIWSCSRWGLPSRPVTRPLVGSYIKGLASPHHFTLTERLPVRRYLSVALSLSFVRGEANFGRWTLSTTASCGARTFLPSPTDAANRIGPTSDDRPADPH